MVKASSLVRTSGLTLPRASGMLLLFGAAVLGCPDLGGVSSSVDKAVNTIQQSVDTLAQQSDQWQSTLTKLEHDLITQGESGLATEVTQLAQRGISTGGIELRCNADFVG